jgi:hypothetical protein
MQSHYSICTQARNGMVNVLEKENLVRIGVIYASGTGHTSNVRGIMICSIGKAQTFS